LRARDLETLELPRVLGAIAAHARSAAGRDAVLALRPLPDAAGAEARLAATSELVTLAREAGDPPTADVPLLAPALAAAAPEGAALEPRRLAEVRDVLGVARQVRTWLRRDAARFPLASAHAEALADPTGLEGDLEDAIDERGQVRDDASPALAAARTLTRELRREMESRLERLVRDPALSDVIAETYVTVRNGRLVVPIRVQAASSFDGVVQDRSASGETVFLEPLFAVELNNRILLASKDEEIEERRVRMALTGLVRAAAPSLQALEAALATVDALAAAVTFATRHGCTRPELGTPDVLLPAARHPLLLDTGRTVVPVDIRLPADRRALAITGPNAGGKTVAMKTLGLCALMAHAGLFVPAGDGSRLPRLGAVLTDIGDDQSIERDLSTFSAHAENLAAIAAAARDATLILLDEPGAGTDPIEGAALAVGLLTDLLERGPRIVFTSHFPQVKTFALASPLVDVAAFDVDPATGAPRFRLTYHTVGQSFALPIARRHGLPARALETAERLLSGESHDLARAVARLEESRASHEANRAETERERAARAAARAEADALVADLRERQRHRWSDDLEASRRLVRDIEARGRALLDELRARPEPQALRTFVRDTAAALAEQERAIAGPAPSARTPVPGDMVEVAGHGIRGELVEVTGERARIRRGGLRFEVATDQLRVVDSEPPRAQVAVTYDRPEEPEDEIKLIGRRVGEALEALTTFLDRAMRAGLGEVRVVHGLGSGALRKAVRQLLDSTPYCASYRDAEPAAGGAGVTVVELA
jgi:DNA mismatch repair protein MutS2